MGPAALVLDLDLVAEISALVPVGLAVRSYPNSPFAWPSLVRIALSRQPRSLVAPPRIVYAHRCMEDYTSSGGDNQGPTWAPNGRHLAFQSNRLGRWQVFAMLADGSAPAPLTRGQSESTSPSWSPRLP